MFVGRLSPSGPAAKAGVKLLHRIESLGDEVVEGMYEWARPVEPERKGEDELPSFTMVAGGISVRAERRPARCFSS